MRKYRNQLIDVMYVVTHIEDNSTFPEYVITTDYANDEDWDAVYKPRLAPSNVTETPR